MYLCRRFLYFRGGMNAKKYFTICLLAAAWIAAAVCGVQADDEDYSGGMLDRARALAAARDISTNVYPDADAVLADGMIRIRYYPDGTYVQWHEEFVKILTEKGRREHRALSSYFTIPYQRGPEDCRVDLVEIVRPDGSTTVVDVPAQSRIMVDPSSMSANIYNPNRKILQVNVPGLNVGDTLHFVMYDREVQPRMKGNWSNWQVFESTRPIVRQVVEIAAPSDLPLRSIALKDEIPGTVQSTSTQTPDGVLYRWEALNVPRMFPEPNMPPPHTVVQRLLASTAPDWESVSRWYFQLSEPHCEPSPEIRAKVDELVRDAPDWSARAQALFGFVAQEIRYMGITVEAVSPGYEPHDVKDTFEARHGVCRDKAALLVVMLREAGIEAYPTLIHNGTKKDPEVPQPYFNHAIVAAKPENGDYVLMDPTDETAASFLPAYLNDKSFLVATPAGDVLRTSPIDPASNHMMRVVTTGSLDAGGGLSAETELRFEGVNDNAYRHFLATSREEDRRRFFEGLVKHAAPGATVTSLAIHPEDLLDTSTVLTARVTYEAKDVLIVGEDLAALPLPMLGPSIGIANFIIGKTGLRERKYPLITQIACGISESLSLELDPALTELEAIPRGDPFHTDALSWSMVTRQEDARLVSRADFRLEKVEFSPAEYQDLKTALKEIEVTLRRMPLVRLSEAAVLQAKATGGDAIIESVEVEYDLADADNWTERKTVRKRILTYAGKKQNAEIKIQFNPAWEDVEIERAVVTGADGTVKTIRPEEINVMDAAWVGSAPRYPPERIKVVSLPGVEEECVLEFCQVTTSRGRPFFSVRESFRALDFLASKRVTVSVPADLPLRFHEFLAEGFSSSIRTNTAASRVEYEWEASKAAAVKREDNLPPWWSFTPTVSISAGEWRRFARDTGDALQLAARKQRAAVAAARELTRGMRDPREKLRAIRDFVDVRIRPAGPGLNRLPLTAITPADVTLRDGYANGADRAVLLSAMLKAAGFRPQFVLVSSLRAIDSLVAPLRESPSRDVFTDVLVRVTDRSLSLAEGRSLYLGDTDQYAVLGASPHAGRIGMTVPDGAWHEIAPAEEDRSVLQIAIELDSDGTAAIHREQLLFGNLFGSEHRRYREMTPEDRRRYYQEMVAEVSQSAEAVGDLDTDFSGYPGRVAFRVNVPRYAVRDAEYLYLALPHSLATVLSLRADERENPIFLTDNYSFDTTIALGFPEEFGVALKPLPVRWEGVHGIAIDLDTRMSESAKDGREDVLLETQVALKPGVLSPDAYRKLLEWDRQLSHKRTRTVILRDLSP